MELRVGIWLARDVEAPPWRFLPVQSELTEEDDSASAPGTPGTHTD